MAITVGDAILYIRGDTSQLRGDLNRVNSTVRGVLGGLGRAAVVGVGALGATVATAGGLAIRAAAGFEQTQIAFTTMLGDADRAHGMLEDLARFAARTPFQLEDVEMGARQLLAMGSSAEEVIPELKMLGDVSAGLNVPIERLILNYGQVRTQNKLTGRELRDFLIAGVPLVDALADHFGVAKDEIADMVSRGEVGFDAVQAAFSSMTSEGGKFFDLMQAQSETTAGKFSNLKDEVQLRLREIGAALLPVASQMLDFGQRALPVLADAFMQKVVPALNAGADALGKLMEGDVQGALSAMFSQETVGKIMDFVGWIQGSLIPALQSFWDWVVEHKDPIIGAFVGIGAALIGLQMVSIIGTIVAALGLLLSPIGALIAIAAVLGAAWATNWGGIREKAAAAKDFLIRIFVALRDRFQWVIDQWNRIFEAFRLAFQGDWRGFGEKLREVWDETWRRVKEVGRRGLDAIKDFFRNTDWGQVGRGILEGIANGIRNGVQLIRDAATNAARAALEAAKGFLGIGSPSRAFQDQVGAQIPAGLVKGMESQNLQLAKAMQNMLSGGGGLQPAPAAAAPVPQLVNSGPAMYVQNQYVSNSFDMDRLTNELRRRGAL